MTNPDVVVIGAGLAGSEAAWQLAERGWNVTLHEMRPLKNTPAHTTPFAAEMVCSNSFKSDDPLSATGILKEEMRTMGSMILKAAETARVPAGQSLAVDREVFALRVTRALRSHPRITWQESEVIQPELAVPTILASGPLTSDPLAAWLAAACGQSRLFFYDAIAPIVERESIDRTVAFMASRYDKGEADFLNCPLDKSEYEAFLEALLAAPRAPLHDFETRYFEACLPVEVMAERGLETLRFGPMKPVGLTDPRTGRWPYAAVQLRQDTLAGDHFNMVGFQTRLTWPAQAEVFRCIPGLRDAAFVRYGSIHRNTYLHAPDVLDATSKVKRVPNLWVAGQLSGVEGYLESAASGLAVARFVDTHLRQGTPVPLPRTTVLGALFHFLANSDTKHFSPVNAMLGLLPEVQHARMSKEEINRLSEGRGIKRARASLHRTRAIEALRQYLVENHGGI